MHMAPFDLITRPKEVVAKWRAGRIHLIPFQTVYAKPIEGLDKALINLRISLPVGLLWGLGPVRKEPRRLQILHAAAVGLADGRFRGECSNSWSSPAIFEATDIVTGLLATVIGAEASAAFYKASDRSAGSAKPACSSDWQSSFGSWR